VYGKRGKVTEAISDYTKAIELKPKYAEAYNNRGTAYDELGNAQKPFLTTTRPLRSIRSMKKHITTEDSVRQVGAIHRRHF